MKYDFTTVISRADTGSVKWNLMKKKKPDVSKGIVPFSVADMEFKNPPEVIKGLKQYLNTAILGYQTAEPTFYEAVNSWTKRRYGWETKPEWLYTTPGVVNAFYHGVRAFAKKGEGVIVMTPVYYPFYKAIERSGRKMVRCPLILKDGRYEIDFELFEKLAKLNSNTLLLFSNPHNPVGRVWSKEELAKLGKICLKYHLFIISDEIHCDIIMPGHSFTAFASVSPKLEHQIMTCISPSKTFNLAGVETGCVIIENKSQFVKFKERAAKNAQEGRVNAFGYKACEIAYTKCDEWLEEMISVVYDNHLTLKSFLQEHCPRIKVFDLEGTYLQWLDLRDYGFDKKEQERIMIEEAELFFDEGSLFGPEGNGFERMNLACPKEVMMAGLERLEKVLSGKMVN